MNQEAELEPALGAKSPQPDSLDGTPEGVPLRKRSPEIGLLAEEVVLATIAYAYLLMSSLFSRRLM
jgi:hypothetical protein